MHAVDRDRLWGEIILFVIKQMYWISNLKLDVLLYGLNNNEGNYYLERNIDYL